MSTITVRQAVLTDLEALVPLFDGYRQFYGRASDPDAARKFLMARFNHHESVLFIAHDGDTPVGFTQLYPSFSSVSLARVFILNDLYVHEHARRKGVASKLMGEPEQIYGVNIGSNYQSQGLKLSKQFKPLAMSV